MDYSWFEIAKKKATSMIGGGKIIFSMQETNPFTMKRFLKWLEKKTKKIFFAYCDDGQIKISEVN